MVTDLYHTIKADPSYTNKLVGDDYMIVEYKCPVETERFQLFSELHFIVYVISGKKDWFASGKIYTAQAGDALFIRKGAYTTRQYFEEDNCVLVFFMNDDFIRNFYRDNNLRSLNNHPHSSFDQIFQLEVDDVLKSVFLSVFAYLKMQRDIPRRLVELKFRELLFNVILNPKHQSLASYLSTLLHAGKVNLDDVMMKNFRHDLQLEEFARLCDRSLSAFKRDFKSYYNQSPGKWLTEKRLEYANALLLGTDMNVNEICYEIGFANPTHFNKAFKSRYLLPPNQFRIQGKTKNNQPGLLNQKPELLGTSPESV
jgi:AraC-like DNA-binding protein